MILLLFTSLALATHFLLIAQASSFSLLGRATPTPTPTPLSVAPAQNWDGDDGPWSSFTIRVGTPAQNVRVLISTSNYNSFVVLPAGCPVGDSNCAELRGGTYNYNSSSTWSQHGYYEINSQKNLNVSTQAVYGNETLGLGIQGSGGPELPDQIIGGVTSQQFYLGLLGMNPRSTNFSAQDQGQLSTLSTLKNQGLIPSLTLGYTAGAQYQLKQVLGSLTLGGMDSARFTPNSLSIPFAPDPGRDLMVGVQSIKSVDKGGKSTDLLTNGIMSFVDTAVPQIWLPLEACQAFEETFGLIYDEDSELYLVNSSLHDDLRRQEPSFTFTLGAAATGGPTIDITLPYESFDMLAKPPTNGVANSSRYFPLRRAANESQYTLGRAFLQESYLTVDWERRNFSLSQCIFNDDLTQNLVPIASIDQNSTSLDGSSSGSSTGRTAGIAVGVVVGVLIIAGAIAGFIFYRRRKDQKTQAKEDDGTNPNKNLIDQGFDDKGELGTENENRRFEMDVPHASKPQSPPLSGWVNEKAQSPGMHSSADIPEVDAGVISTPELGSPHHQQQRGEFPFHGTPLHEMQDPSAPPAELPGTQPEAPELHGSNPTSAASSPGFFARRSRRSRKESNGNNAGAGAGASPASHSLSTRRLSGFRERFSSSRPAGASRTSTGESVPSLTSDAVVAASSAPAAQPHSLPPSSSSAPPRTETETPPVGAGHSGEPFSPISSRQGTGTGTGSFSPEPISRQGTERQAEGMFSPVSPSSPMVGMGWGGGARGGGG